MPNLFFTIGLPAAGKSSLYKKEYSYATYVSSDAIRAEVFGDINDQTHNSEVFDIMFHRTMKALKGGNDVYYDQTGLSSKRRISFLKSISHIPNVTKICLLIIPPIEQVIRQNAIRDRSVPLYVIRKMLKNFVVPHKSEGWNEIKIYGNIYNGYTTLNQLLEYSRNISHDNPHHTLSIGNHMIAAAEYYREHYVNNCRLQRKIDLYEPILFHDIGKLHCKTFTNRDGNNSEIAHYYNHANVSAYFYLSKSKGDIYDLYNANLIQYHMIFFENKNYQDKLRKRLRELFWEDLLIVHECDAAGH